MSKPLDWADTKYKPQSFDEIVGNAHAIEKIKRYAKSGNFPHCLFLGPPGTGKTVSAELLCKSVGVEYKIWDASEDRKLKMIQGKVIKYAQMKPLTAPFKAAIMDECDKLTPDAQDSLRGPMVTYSSNCRFILITNVASGIISWVRSRTEHTRFWSLSPEDVASRLIYIAECENLQKVITKDQIFKISELSEGDMRQAIKKLQGLCQGRNDVVTDKEIELVSLEKEVETVGQAISAALAGDYSESVRIIDTLLYSGVSVEDAFNTIISEFPKSYLTEQQKIVIGLSLGKLDFLHLSSRHQLYATLAFIADNKC